MRMRAALTATATLLTVSLPLMASAANVVLNPGFETGFSVGAVAANITSNNWSTNDFLPNGAADHTASFAIVSDAHAGSNAASITMSNYVAGDAKWVPTPVAVSAGQFYTVSFWYKSTAPVSAFVVYNNGTEFNWIVDLPVAADWTQFTSNVLVPAGKTDMTVLVALNSNGELTTDDYSIDQAASAPVFSQGHVTLTFDDGWQSFNDVAVPVLNGHGNLKATAYVVTGPQGSNIGGTANDGFMTTATVTALQNAGFEIGDHTTSHLDLVNQATGAGQQYADQNAMWQGEIFASRTDLTGAGFTPVTTFAYPYGQYNASVKTQVQNAGFTSARSVDQGFNFTNSDKFSLKIMPINNQSTAAGINALIDQAVSDKTWLILMFHNVRAGNETQGSLNAACVEPVTDANGDPVVPAQTQPDVDCTTQGVLDGIAAHLQAAPSGTVVTMGQGVAAMDAATSNIITASSDSNGTITPNGAVSVVNGASQAFTLTPNSGFHFGTLLVDGVSAATTSANTYTFTNVTAAHTIAVTYVADVDTIAPTVTLSTTAAQSPSQTNMSPIPVTVTFSEAVTGFDAADATASVTGGTVSNFASTATTATFDVTPTADGPVTVSVAAGAAQDVATVPNPSVASNVLNLISNRTLPVIVLTGDAYVSTPVGTTYTDAGATVSGTTTLPTQSGSVDTATVGTYTMTYSFTDSAGNVAAPVVRTVVVTELGTMSDEAASAVTTSSFTVTWTTVASGTSRVVYDTVSHNPLTATTSNYGYAFSTTEDASTTLSHSVTISGLTPGVTYYFRAVSHGSPEIVGAEMSVKTSGGSSSSSSSSSSNGGGGGGGNGPISGSLGVGGSLIPSFNSAPLPGGSVLGASTFKFLNNLSKGMTHGDVMELQKRLVAEGFMTIDAPTSYFGNLTFMAVKKYQGAHGIEQVGNVGPKTRAALNGGSVSAPTVDASKQALIDMLKAKLADLMKKIAELMAAGTGSSTTATTTTETTTTSTSTPGVDTSTSTSSTSTMTGTSTTSTASSTQQ